MFSQAGGWLLINYALGDLPASTAVIVLLGQPVVTGLLSIPLLGELLTPRQVLGGLVVLPGIYLCLKRILSIFRGVSVKCLALFGSARHFPPDY